MILNKDAPKEIKTKLAKFLLGEQANRYWMRCRITPRQGEPSLLNSPSYATLGTVVYVATGYSPSRMILNGWLPCIGISSSALSKSLDISFLKGDVPDFSGRCSPR